jgi:hypothetical protein
MRPSSNPSANQKKSKVKNIFGLKKKDYVQKGFSSRITSTWGEKDKDKLPQGYRVSCHKNTE